MISKVSNKETRKIAETCSKLTTKIPANPANNSGTQLKLPE